MLIVGQCFFNNSFLFKKDNTDVDKMYSTTGNLTKHRLNTKLGRSKIKRKVSFCALFSECQLPVLYSVYVVFSFVILFFRPKATGLWIDSHQIQKGSK